MIIVITGTRKGIGRYLAEQFLVNDHIVIGCSRGECDLNHKNYHHYILDVTNEEAVEQFAREVRKRFQFIDALINNAGTASMNHFMMMPTKTVRNLMELNYVAVFNMSKEFVRCLRKSSHPRIVNFSTIAVPLNLEGEMAYTSSKAAIESMTKIMAKELANFNITVNAVAPTPIQTDLIAKVPQEKIEKLLELQTIKRFGKMKDIKNVVDFYLSEESDFVTGQIIYLGGINR